MSIEEQQQPSKQDLLVVSTPLSPLYQSDSHLLDLETLPTLVRRDKVPLVLPTVVESSSIDPKEKQTIKKLEKIPSQDDIYTNSDGQKRRTSLGRSKSFTTLPDLQLQRQLQFTSLDSESPMISYQQQQYQERQRAHARFHSGVADWHLLDNVIGRPLAPTYNTKPQKPNPNRTHIWP